MGTFNRRGFAARFAAGIFPLLAAALLASPPPPAHAQSSDSDALKAKMRGVLVNLTTAYRYSLDPVAFEDAKNREQIRNALRGLVSAATALELHSQGLDESFEYLRLSLAEDARDALARYLNRQYMGSRFVIGQITNNCVACHSKLPAKPVDVGASLTSAIDADTLLAEQRVQLLMATRQFDKAIATYERMFADPSISAQTLALTGAFEHYLRLCLSVRDDRDRALATIEKYRERPSLPGYQAEVVKDWVDALRSLPSPLPQENRLEVARSWIDAAEEKQQHPSDRRGLVEFTAAASLLHRYLQDEPEDDESVALAYYLLAVCEAHTSQSYWLSEVDHLLAQSIRRAPKAPIARRALEFLEQYTLAGHAMTARGVPEDLRTDIDTLRALVEE